MKYPYQEYETVTELGMRWYQTPVGSLPSITTILSASQSDEKTNSLQNWRDSIGHDRADEHTKKAQDHGTMVHLMSERFLKQEDPFANVDGVEISSTDKLAFNALKLKLKNITEVWGQEQSIYSPILEVAGRFDCAGVYKGIPSIIDFKTAGKIKARSEIDDYFLQLLFYMRAHNELFNTNIQQGVILMVSGGGMPLEFWTKDYPELRDALQKRIDIFWEKTLSKF